MQKRHSIVGWTSEGIFKINWLNHLAYRRGESDFDELLGMTVWTDGDFLL